jgi:hypothetical protein
MKACKLLLGALSASVLLGALVGSASAGRLSTSSQTWRATFREVNLRLPFFTSRCQITLEGSFHTRTMAKVAGSLVGYITRALLGPCSNGTKTILSETLPWHLQYAGFTGTLPRIVSIRFNVVGWSQRIREPFGITCLFRSTATEPVTLNFNRNTTTGALETAEIGGSIRTVGESCGEIPAALSSDRGPVTVLNSTTRITVTLI